MTTQIRAAELAAMEARFEAMKRRELEAMERRFQAMKRREQPPTTVNGPPVSPHISNAELLAMEARRKAADRRLAVLKYRTQNS